MPVQLFWSSNYFGKKKTPLLSGYKANYGTFKERQPLLLDELRACIALLEAAKKKTPYKKPQLQRDYRKYAVLFMSLALLGLSGTGGTLTVMLMMMRFAHEKILPELQKQLQSLYEYLNYINNEITDNDPDVIRNKHYKIHDDISDLKTQEHQLFEEWWDSLNNPYHSDQYYDDRIKTNDSINNCVEWNSTAGRQKLIDIFPEISSDPDNPCWFDVNDKTHPLQKCVEIANNTCRAAKQIETLNQEHDVIWDKEMRSDDIIKNLKNDKTDFENQISSLESRIDNPYSEADPLTNTIFAAVALLSIAGIIYAAYRLYHSRKAHHADIESHGNSVKRFLSSIDQTEQARVTKLALRLGKSIRDNTTIDNVLSDFKRKAQELELQRKQRMGFFAGVKIENVAAGNHQFLTNEASRNITQTIFEHAGLMSKK